MAFKNKIKPVFFLVLALELICFTVDYFIPRGYGFWFVYILPMILIWRTTPIQIILMTAIVSILVIASVFVTMLDGLPLVPSIVNHIGGVLIIWIISFLFISRINSYVALYESENRLKILNESLESSVRQRTEQVRTLSKELIRVELRERKRFSYILHENLQQMLLGARLLVNQHLRDHDEEQLEKKQDDIKDVQVILDRALKMTRSISIELNPPILPSQGLGSSLRWLINYMQKTYGMKIINRTEGDVESIKGEVQLMLTQMVRELLNNVVQHSGVCEAQLEVNCLNNRIEIVVSDNGKGFNSGEVFERIKDETRLGLFSIREKLNLFGGGLTILSAPGQGTTCRLILPLDNCKEGENE